MTLNFNRRSVVGGLIALPACRASGSKFDAEVIVIGAGLAGLRAAQLLTAQGKDVLVLEGSEQVGGRLKTYNYSEFGKIEARDTDINDSTKRLVTLTRDMGIELSPKNGLPNSSYFYDGVLYNTEAWRKLATRLFSTGLEGTFPDFSLPYLAWFANPLNTNTDWQDPRFAAYDISAQDFLLEAGFDGDEQTLISQTFPANSLRNYSMMNLYRDLQFRSNTPAQTIKNGLQTLPEAIARTLPRKVLTNQIVSNIAIEPDKAVVTTSAGKSFTAEYCLCAIPFGALRNIAIKAFMPAVQIEAIRDLPQLQQLNIHVKTETPFWEADGEPVDMWTDMPLERVEAVRDAAGSPTGLFNIIINGRNATRSLWEDSRKINDSVRTYLKTVRPASNGDFKVLAVQDWTRNNPLMGGAKSYWAPGQIRKWAADMGRNSKQLVFAGEHLSHKAVGLEAALDSAEIAAKYLLK